MEVKFNCFTKEGDLFLSSMFISFQDSISLIFEVPQDPNGLQEGGPFPQFSLQVSLQYCTGMEGNEEQVVQEI